MTGLVQLDGQALPGGRVLLISGDMTRFLGSTTTDEDGAFEIAVPAEHRRSQVVLLLKVQGPVIALVHRLIDLEGDGWGPHEFRLDSAQGDFHNVSGEVLSTTGWPPYLTMFVDPIHIETIPEPLEKFFRWQDERVVESYFFKKRLDGEVFSLKVMSGVYRVGASYLNYFRPEMVNPEFENYVAVRAEADGESQPLPGERNSGYLLDVKRDRHVVLTIEVVPDEELSSVS